MTSNDTLATGLELLRGAIRKLSTGQIVEAIRYIGGDWKVNADARIARAALIDVYIEREGEEAGDSLMDALGM